jgi:hypothetical protein
MPGGGKRTRESSATPRSQVLSIVVTLALGLLLTGMCACGVLLYRQWPTFTSDPAAAQQLTEQMLSIRVPPDFHPQGTIVWRIWFMMTLQGAYYAHAQGSGELAFVEVDSTFLAQEKVREHVIASLRQYGASSGLDLSIRERQTLGVTIRGEQVAFNIMPAEDRITNRSLRLLDGIVPGTKGPVLVSLWLDDELWNEEAVVGMLESIGQPDVAAEGAN